MEYSANGRPPPEAVVDAFIPNLNSQEVSVMISARLHKLLDDRGIKYMILKHSPAYTAQEIAASAHIHGRELAKTVMVKIDGTMAMVVLPADERVDFEMLEMAFDARRVELACEEEFSEFFPGCQAGAMPPFGNLYGLKVYLANDMTQNEEICFNAGSHTELIRMRLSDFMDMVQPRVFQFAMPA